MILRRLTDAMKKQDWFQVTIEILIVVIGIFLGLQVTEWNEGRLAKVEESRIIEYFITDLEKNTDVLEDRILFMDNQISKGYSVLALLEGERLSSEDKADFEEGRFIMGRTHPLTAFLNSVNEENLNKILNVKLRQILDGYVGYLKRTTGVNSNIKSTMDDSMTYIQLKSAIVDSGDTERLVFYNFDLLRNDPDYKSSFANALQGILAYRLNSSKMIEYSQKLVEILKQYQVGEELEEASFK